MALAVRWSPDGCVVRAALICGILINLEAVRAGVRSSLSLWSFPGQRPLFLFLRCSLFFPGEVSVGSGLLSSLCS